MRIGTIPDRLSWNSILSSTFKSASGVAPIVDLRNCFNLEDADYGATTVVIMVKAEGNQRDRVVGIVVDAVSEVYNVSMEDIEPPPADGNGCLDRIYKRFGDH